MYTYEVMSEASLAGTQSTYLLKIMPFFLIYLIDIKMRTNKLIADFM